MSLGLRADETSYLCIVCSARFCGRCQSSHAITHSGNLVRQTIQIWTQHMATIAEVASCSECSLDIRCRVECLVCSRNICFECYSFANRRLPFYAHRNTHTKGNGFVVLSAPTCSVVPQADHECDCLSSPGCISHCNSCLRGT